MHPDHGFRLNWGVNDAYEISHFLQGTAAPLKAIQRILKKKSFLERCGFRRNDIRILTDDQHDNLPTKANIVSYPYRVLRPSADSYRLARGDALVGQWRSTWGLSVLLL